MSHIACLSAYQLFEVSLGTVAYFVCLFVSCSR